MMQVFVMGFLNQVKFLVVFTMHNTLGLLYHLQVKILADFENSGFSGNSF